MLQAMKDRIKRYFSSWWRPAVVSVGLLTTLITYDLTLNYLHITGPAWLSNTLFALFLIALVSVLGGAIYQFVTRSKKIGLLSLVLFIVILAGSVPALMVAFIYASFLGPSEDGFGKDITIPADMVYENPLPRKSLVTPVPVDPDSRALANAVAGAGSPDGAPVVTVGLDVLNQFTGENRNRLLRHLASSAKWFVTGERDAIHAVRRYAEYQGRWESSLDVHFSTPDDGQADPYYYQLRILIGIDGPVHGGGWWPGNDTEAATGAGKTTLTLKEGVNKGHDSFLVVRSKGPAVEISEDTKIRPRPITALALAQINTELTALLQSDLAKTRGFDPDLLPPGSMKAGASELHLINGGQGGSYEVFTYVNPGEAGHVYLKVFEATRNTRLSEYRITQRSVEYTGWSGEPNTQFLYNTRITVYEGDWEIYYPARFELWFVPASGGPERKLIEKVFRIEGWMR